MNSAVMRICSSNSKLISRRGFLNAPWAIVVLTDFRRDVLPGLLVYWRGDSLPPGTWTKPRGSLRDEDRRQPVGQSGAACCLHRILPTERWRVNPPTERAWLRRGAGGWSTVELVRPDCCQSSPPRLSKGPFRLEVRLVILKLSESRLRRFPGELDDYW